MSNNNRIFQCKLSLTDEKDLEVLKLSERLFEASTPNIFEDITVNLQGKNKQYSTEDAAPKPLFTYVNNTVLSEIPTVVSIRELFNKYDQTHFSIDKTLTLNDFLKENDFLSKIIDTPVMQIAMNFLHKEGSEEII
ncbi:poly(U)-specific endoribonuclease homolog [Contarinia nasturtii]|uniref:poly(U)-specific endoribonuclease homolog n=1 Tax=Contarinia nasturtii TaxID=265458 RepID=UPI0012D447B4|nr:poly(U)-specific endoribonuclease homolog [Contarinia nasturtii]